MFSQGKNIDNTGMANYYDVCIIVFRQPKVYNHTKYSKEALVEEEKQARVSTLL